MHKNFFIVLVLVYLLSFSSTALAAIALVEVPANHWAYQSTAKLAKAGIIPGYNEGMFIGGNMLTRYEFAIIVTKAMINQDKANQEQIIEIAKLQAEFNDELQKLGIYIKPNDQKADKLKFNAEVRTRYEWSKDSAQSPQSGTRLRLGMKAQLTDDLVFIGKYQAESPFASGGDDKAQLTQAFITGKALGCDVIIAGRQFLLLGQGLLADNDGPADGLVVGWGDNKFMVVGGTVTVKAVDETYIVGNVSYNPTKDISISASYAKANDNLNYKSWATGFNYKGFPNLGVTFEYGENGANLVKAQNGGNSAKAWMTKVKYRGADATKPKSYGLWLGYRNADPGFDIYGFTSLANDHARTANIGAMDNVKGFQYGLEYTMCENAIAKVMYNQLKQNNGGNVKGDNLLVQMTYTF